MEFYHAGCKLWFHHHLVFSFPMVASTKACNMYVLQQIDIHEKLKPYLWRSWLLAQIFRTIWNKRLWEQLKICFTLYTPQRHRCIMSYFCLDMLGLVLCQVGTDRQLHLLTRAHLTPRQNNHIKTMTVQYIDWMYHPWYVATFLNKPHKKKYIPIMTS